MDELVIEFDGSKNPEFEGFSGTIKMHLLPYNLPNQRIFRVDYECTKGKYTHVGWREFSLMAENELPDMFHRGKVPKRHLRSVIGALEKVIEIASEEIVKRKPAAPAQNI